MKRCLLVLIMIFSLFGIEAFSKEWNGIIPCVSTRFDAEKILGKDDFPINVGIYHYNEFRVHVIYERKDKTDPDKDIVKNITVYPDKSISLTKYIKKIPNFHKNFRKTEIDIKISHVYGEAVYRNWNEGFEIWVQKDDEDKEIISSFGYFDPAYDCSE